MSDRGSRVNRMFLGLALLAGVSLAGSPLLQSAEQQTLEGTVTDSMCGLKHTMGSPAKDCTLQCVGMGSKFALAVGTDVYQLDGKTDDLKAFAGEKVKLTGMVGGKKIQVESVAKP